MVPPSLSKFLFNKDQIHFPGQVLRRRLVHKWNDLSIQKNVFCSRHLGKQDTVVERSEVEQGEDGDGEQCADVEVHVPRCRVAG